MSLRRQFSLPPEDERFLDEYALPWETVIDGSAWVFVHQFPTRGPYNTPIATAAIRIETGYPAAALDMGYFYPALTRTDGIKIGATETIQVIDGKAFQRWSRHRTPQNPWRIACDNLGTHIILIEDWLEREFRK